MDITISPHGVLSAFDQLGDSAKKAFLALLENQGYFHATKERAIADIREQIRSLKAEIRQLERENDALKSRPIGRAFRQHKKLRILELHQRAFNSSEIAKQLAKEGIPAAPDAIRQLLRRLQAKNHL